MSVDGHHLVTSDEIMKLDSLPESLVVLGGGVIGCEYACMFASLGIEVTLVEAKDRFLGFLDAELSRMLQARMEGLGVRFHMPDQVAQVRPAPHEVVLALDSGAEVKASAVRSFSRYRTPMA